MNDIKEKVQLPIATVPVAVSLVVVGLNGKRQSEKDDTMCSRVLHKIQAKYRAYSPSALHNAYKSVVDNGAPVLRASRMYGVPQQTLRDRVLGKIDPECVTTGREPVLSMFEEAKIVKHIKTMADYGYGYTMQECTDIATEYAVSLGKKTRDNPLTLRRMDGFRKRWPEVKVSNPRVLNIVRAKMTSETTVNAYFSNLTDTLIKYDLLDKPHRIFNVDEKGFSPNHKPPYIVSYSSGPPAVTTGKSKTITILGCGHAGGISIPPYYVFPGKRMLPELLAGSSPGIAGTVSESGWSNSAIFRKYLEEHFLKYLPGGNGEPVLLLLDGHKSHVSVTLAAFRKTEIFPLDKSAIARDSLIPAVVFQCDSNENDDTDSQATVEAGILVGEEMVGDFLLERELNLKKLKVKNQSRSQEIL
ncbi:uncharacterized protein LOC128558058 [Mercenaria mercenaria]|uniref:uncharacterized protein LOC128558058 n=1 Tax=Mercenaria mercenaria TaxID=6596 RepID=UPI00234ED59D|nr:uncharacterized protein LOC128558058 [Mercenaria mercenaria]